MSAEDAPPVPARLRGVWVRRLLATPTARDDTTVVRWLQTARWHADLRIPACARPAGDGDVTRLALQQGFAGVTTVHPDAAGEVCTWHRHVDLQPPAMAPDAGRIAFDGPDRLLETGLHADYHEVWERLPGSQGRYAVVVAGGREDDTTWWLLAGCCLMRVRPRSVAWPAGVAPGTTLADVVRTHPAHAAALVDFEISFGSLADGVWSIGHSTRPSLEGRAVALALHRRTESAAVVECDGVSMRARILEWDAATQRLD
ncbi:hypothetical protein [Azohydromonas sediminis]|uniref:hypothetical protein n=1 Tax=Azohydromonas sediminis TaxID=2259674 RepID=UPI000E64BF0A|nr:hypothetical protein [Azohydromonas sediminis]